MKFWRFEFKYVTPEKKVTVTNPHTGWPFVPNVEVTLPDPIKPVKKAAKKPVAKKPAKKTTAKAKK